MPTLYDNFSQVKQYIDQEKPDLTSYVTKTELANASYVTSSDLNNYLLSPTISGYEGQMKLYNDGFFEVTSSGAIRAKSFTYNQLNSWSAYTLINRNSLRNYVDGRIADIESTYATQTYVADYVAEHGGGGSTVIDENIIPKETNTYTLGDSSYLFANVYTNNINYPGNGGWVKIGNNAKYLFTSSSFRPNANNSLSLGASQYYWGDTYTANIYTENVSYTSGKSSIKMNDRNVDIWANNKKLVNLSDYDGVVPTQTNFNLGTSTKKWGSTYTQDLYADNIHNFIWTGTSAEYAALPDYTTYQIYMIKEA